MSLGQSETELAAHFLEKLGRSRVSEDSARRLAQLMDLYVSTERLLIAHRDDEDATELRVLTELWVGYAREINSARSRLEREILVMPIEKQDDDA